MTETEEYVLKAAYPPVSKATQAMRKKWKERRNAVAYAANNSCFDFAKGKTTYTHPAVEEKFDKVKIECRVHEGIQNTCKWFNCTTEELMYSRKRVHTEHRRFFTVWLCFRYEHYSYSKIASFIKKTSHIVNNYFTMHSHFYSVDKKYRNKYYEYSKYMEVCK